MWCLSERLVGPLGFILMAKARSLSEFQKEFPDEARCAVFLFERRWPEGFVCPVSTPERSCIGSPERKCINDGGKKAPGLGAFS